MTQKFQPQQIVSLDRGTSKLYAEVIQVVVARQLCWVRPLLLVEVIDEEAQMTDLREASDLFWPIDLFRPALDTEVINFLSQLLVKEPKPELDLASRQLLNKFIHEAWKEYKGSGD
ncbi:MAG: hypothetical protein KME64_08905 [Scytonematopsis contorta HA4267-MV1]|jgi:hypothetical protein|nr:hypothetical protein [Scytonematopsis contorta HA4267-MV1]